MRKTESRLSILSFLVIIVMCTLYSPGYISIFRVEASSSWLSGWNYRKSHVINPAVGAGQEYQVCIKAYKGTGMDGTEIVYGFPAGRVYLGNNVRDDFGDVRFTGSDGTAEVKYWLQEYTFGTSAVFWVKVAESLESSPATMYVYYGNSAATTTSSGTETFIAFADFESGINGWTNIDLDTFERTDAESFGGSYSLHCKRASVNDRPANAYKSVSFPSTYCYHLAFRISGVDELELSVYFSGAIGYENGVRLYPYASGLRYKLGDTTSQACGQGYSINTWYIGNIRRTSTNNWELAYYNSSGSNIWEKTDCSFTPTQTIDRIGVSPENNNDLYIDNTFVRKYTSSGNEPVHSTWGNEEASAKTRMYIDPAVVDKNSSDIGKTFILNVTIEDVRDLRAFDYNITWDNGLLSLVSIDFDTTLNAIWGSGNWVAVLNSSGLGYYKLVTVSTLNGFNMTGSASLTILTFRSEDPLTNSVKNTTVHFATHKLSDSGAQPIDHTVEDGTYRITGIKPSINLNPLSQTCRKYGEQFSVKVDVLNASCLVGLQFEIDYDTTLLDYSDISWNAWGAGTVIVDETNGKIEGSTSGSMLNDSLTLMTIEFKASYHRIWKDLSGWVNNQSGNIMMQCANLSYPSAPDLTYIRGILDQVNVGPDVNYTFSPIQGDVDNDGDVDVFDLRTVACYYDQVNDTYNLVGSNTIDLFDLVVIASNFGYTYDP